MATTKKSTSSSTRSRSNSGSSGTRTRSTRSKPASRDNSPFRRAVPFTALLVAGVLLALFYVHLDTRIEKQAKDVVAVETEIREATHAVNAERNAWERMLTAQSLTATIHHHGLDMSFPGPSQRVVLTNHDEWVRRQTAMAAVARLPLEKAPVLTVSAAAAATTPDLAPPPVWARRFLNVSTTAQESHNQ